MWAPSATLVSMLILHTSDWHLGRTLHGASLGDSADAFIEWLVALVRERGVDAVLISGDVFDRAVPPVDALARMRRALRELTALTTVVLTSGNHDGAARLGLFADMLTPSSARGDGSGGDRHARRGRGHPRATRCPTWSPTSCVRRCRTWPAQGESGAARSPAPLPPGGPGGRPAPGARGPVGSAWLGRRAPGHRDAARLHHGRSDLGLRARHPGGRRPLRVG